MFPTIRIRHDRHDYTGYVTEAGLSCVQTLQNEQWDYLLAAFVGREDLPKDLPARQRSMLKRIAALARDSATNRAEDGLPKRPAIIVPAGDWKQHVGGILIHTRRWSYVPVLLEERLDPRKAISVYLPTRSP